MRETWAPRARVPIQNELDAKLLRNRTTHRGKYVISIRTNQPDCPHHDDQNHSQHHGVFRDILALLCAPQLM